MEFELVEVATQLLQYGIVGAIVTGAVSYLRSKFGTSDNASKLLAVGVSIVVAIILYLLSLNEEILQGVLAVLAAGQTVYSLFGKDLQSSNQARTNWTG